MLEIGSNIVQETPPFYFFFKGKIKVFWKCKTYDNLFMKKLYLNFYFSYSKNKRAEKFRPIF